MRTPVYDFVEEYISKDGVRAHMPGHKGRGPLGIEQRDITEIAGADILSESEGILGESQKNACALFGTGATLYSTEGSSLAIKAMLYAVVMNRGTGISENSGQRPFILAARNVHRAMLDGCALLDLDVEFISSKNSRGICSCVVTAEDVAHCLERYDKPPAAVYLTSPDYLGVQSDIRAIAQVCHEKGVLLAVDNAHGAYLAFLRENRHPVYLGADICCDSAHKTLPVLTGGAYIHINRNAMEDLTENARKGLSMFGSTSPSYVILQSLDLCNHYLATDFGQQLEDCVKQVEMFKKTAGKRGIRILSGEPLKVVMDTGASGYDGRQITEELREFSVWRGKKRRSGIECEFADRHHVVLMVSPQNDEDDWKMLYEWLDHTRLQRQQPALAPAQGLENISAVRRMSIREAVFAASETIPVTESEGRILAQETVSCPPAIPIAVSGEQISREMIGAFQEYGILHISVVR